MLKHKKWKSLYLFAQTQNSFKSIKMILSSHTPDEETKPKGKVKKVIKPDLISKLVDAQTDDTLDSLELRPQRLSDYIGQEKLKKQLQLIIDSAKIREKLPEHVLFYGQPGLGKTTLGSLISSEIGANFKVITAPSLQRVGDLISMLLNLEANTVLFIDEIHRLKAPLEETLYSAMENSQVDLIMGKGHGISSTRIDLPPIMFVGATTQLGKVSKPLKDRFPSVFRIEPYNDSEILELIDRNCKILKLKIDDEAKLVICRRCRGVPRITNNILKRLLDYQVVHHIKSISKPDALEFLEDLGIYEKGLTKADIGYLEALLDTTLGLKTLGGVLLEETETLELVTEPYLIHLGYVDKSSGGRSLTPKGREFIIKFKKINTGAIL